MNSVILETVLFYYEIGGEHAVRQKINYGGNSCNTA